MFSEFRPAGRPAGLALAARPGPHIFLVGPARPAARQAGPGRGGPRAGPARAHPWAKSPRSALRADLSTLGRLRRGVTSDTSGPAFGRPRRLPEGGFGSVRQGESNTG